MKKKLWLTYTWADNEEEDIDFIVKELDPLLDVKLDKRNLAAGRRLWKNIEYHICDPTRCDAWAIVLTPKSIVKQPCVEEMYYALDNVLGGRPDFPIITLAHEVPPSDWPACLRIRKGVLLSNKDWSQEVLAAAERRATGFTPSPQLQEVIARFLTPSSSGQQILEVRPRFRTVSRVKFVFDESAISDCSISEPAWGPPGVLPGTHWGTPPIWGTAKLTDASGKMVPVAGWLLVEQVGPNQSAYFLCAARPKRLWFIWEGNSYLEIVLPP